MEFLVEFALQIPAGAHDSEVEDREYQEAAAAAKLWQEGHLVRLWRVPSHGTGVAVGLYRAPNRVELGRMLETLPLYDWMGVTVTTLVGHPNDPLVNAA